ncbi:hypothetical protein BDR07DRAFT_1487444 [Suillus spraguei]|nr:hypothetical protein BDR07DRAFT_1487444 [Suillus spraguei]
MTLLTTSDNVVPDSPHGQAADNAVQMDDKTKDWAIPDDLATDFDKMKYHFRAEHLPIYYEGQSVLPTDAHDILNSTIVKVQFTIHHWRIQDYDSFQAMAEKITVLRLGPYHHKSNYKHSNADVSANEPQAKKLRSNACASFFKA